MDASNKFFSSLTLYERFHVGTVGRMCVCVLRIHVARTSKAYTREFYGWKLHFRQADAANSDRYISYFLPVQ